MWNGSYVQGWTFQNSVHTDDRRFPIPANQVADSSIPGEGLLASTLPHATATGLRVEASQSGGLLRELLCAPVVLKCPTPSVLHRISPGASAAAPLGPKALPMLETKTVAAAALGSKCSL